MDPVRTPAEQGEPGRPLPPWPRPRRTDTIEGVNTHAAGARYEAAAARVLERRGFTVLDRNVRFGRKEIDLVVRRGPVVAFVEVKGRRGSRFGHPLEAITARKRKEVESVARWWISRSGRPGLIYRFDAVAVMEDAGGRLVVEHVEDAWRPRTCR